MHDFVQIRSNVLHPAASAPWQDTKLHVLHRDYETRSHPILKTVGTYKYATDPSTEVLCCAYAVDDEPVQLWTPGNRVPRSSSRRRPIRAGLFVPMARTLRT